MESWSRFRGWRFPATPAQNLAFNPFPGPVPQESTFVLHGHAGVVLQEAGDRRPALHRHLRQRQRARRCLPRPCPTPFDMAPSLGRRRPAHHHLRRRGQVVDRAVRRRLPRLRAPRREERRVPGRRDRDHPLVRRLAAARQLLRPAGRHELDDRQDRHDPVPGGLQLRAALPLPAGVLGRRSGSDRLGVRHVQQGLGRIRSGVEPQPHEGGRRADVYPDQLARRRRPLRPRRREHRATAARTSRCSRRASSCAATS